MSVANNNKEFLPIFLDFNDTTQDLTDEQCGRLIRALVAYANGMEYEIAGDERIAFRFLKGYIDRNKVLSEKRAQAGSLGGKQTAANNSKQQQTTAKDGNSDNNSNILSDNNVISDADSEKVLDAAKAAGFKCSSAETAALVQLCAEHGSEKLLTGISSCVQYGAINLAYLKAVLQGKPKKESEKIKAIPSQQYPQRPYDDEQDAAMKRMIEAARKEGMLA